VEKGESFRREAAYVQLEPLRKAKTHEMCFALQRGERKTGAIRNQNILFDARKVAGSSC